MMTESQLCRNYTCLKFEAIDDRGIVLHVSRMLLVLYVSLAIFTKSVRFVLNLKQKGYDPQTNITSQNVVAVPRS